MRRVRQYISKKKVFAFQFRGLEDLDLILSVLNLNKFNVAGDEENRGMIQFQYNGKNLEIREGQFIVIGGDGFEICGGAAFKDDWKIARKGKDE